MRRSAARPGRWCRGVAHAAAMTVCAVLALVPVIVSPAPARAAVRSSEAVRTPRAQAGEGGSSLENAAAKAGNTGRAVAMSLIGLALAVAATVLAFRRDFKEAAGVFAVGIVAVLLATPSGVALLRDTVSSLFGSP
jgi:predicted secreted Zn-dependent protease